MQKPASPPASDFPILDLQLVSVLLHARRAQARQSETFDRALPSQEFLDCQRVAPAGVFAQQTAAHLATTSALR
jgi:hypothetical protein